MALLRTGVLGTQRTLITTTVQRSTSFLELMKEVGTSRPTFVCAHDVSALVAQERIHEMLSILEQIVTGTVTVKQPNFQVRSGQLIHLA